MSPHRPAPPAETHVPPAAPSVGGVCFRLLLPYLLPWLLIAVGTCVARADATDYRVVETLADPGDVTCLVADGPTLWAGTLGGGLFRHDQSGSERIGAEHGLRGNRVRGCARVGRDLWVATESGLQARDARGRWRLVQRGRFERLAATGTHLAAVAAGGSVYHGTPGQLRSTPVDGAVSAHAVGPAGEVLLGLQDGRVLWLGAARPAMHTPAGLPVRRVGEREGTWYVETAGGHFAWAGAGLTPTPASTGTRPWQATLAPAARAQLDGYLLQAAVQWGQRWCFGTDAGLWCEPATDSTTAHAATGAAGGAALSRIELPGMPCGDRISALAVLGDTLWIGSFDRGLCARDGDGIRHYAGATYLPSDMVNDLSTDGERLYVATVRGLAIVHPDGRFEQRTVDACRKDRSADCPWHAAVTGVSATTRVGSAPRVWVADAGAVHRVGPKRWKHYYRRAGITSRRVTRVAARGRQVAVGTADAGVLLREGRRFVAWDDSAGLADNWVTDLAFAADGSLWAGTCTRGVSVRTPGGELRQLRAIDGLLDDYVLSVAPLGAVTFVGTLRGLSIVGERGVQNLTTADGLSGNEVHDVVAQGDRVWVATDGGLSLLSAAP